VPWDELTARVRDDVQATGVVVVRSLPFGPVDMLAPLAAALGRDSTVDAAAPAHDARMHAVAARPEPVTDSAGYVILSTTDQSFPCHTDDYFEERPADVVLLHCVRQSDVGGDSLLAHLPDIILRIDEATVTLLSQPSYPTRFGVAPLLEQREGAFQIRYNRLEMERVASRVGIDISAEQVAALDTLDRAIAKSLTAFKLEPRDCLVLNNKTVVHGRTSFDAGSGRLLRRVKLHAWEGSGPRVLP
jgi:alpha-ketoglutarate-dependent taurine dioxygenase